VREQLAEYQGVLLSMFRSEATALKALTLAMAVLKAKAQHLDGRDEPMFPRLFFADIISALFNSPVDRLREVFLEKFINEFDDIRFYTFQAIKYDPVLTQLLVAAC
jgi:U3 small nucleolar RNA-associated protein 19